MGRRSSASLLNVCSSMRYILRNIPRLARSTLCSSHTGVAAHKYAVESWGQSLELQQRWLPPRSIGQVLASGRDPDPHRSLGCVEGAMAERRKRRQPLGSMPTARQQRRKRPCTAQEILTIVKTAVAIARPLGTTEPFACRCPNVNKMHLKCVKQNHEV